MIFILFFIFLTSCSSQFDYIDTTKDIVRKQSKMICKKTGLQIIGSGGAMSDGIKEIMIDFVSYRRVDVNTARKMIVECIEPIRNSLNSEASLESYLVPYPFPVSGMNVGVLFFEKEGGLMKQGCAFLGTGGVSTVSQIKGRLYYSSYNPRTELLEDYYEESYEEALKIVQSEDSCSDDS